MRLPILAAMILPLQISAAGAEVLDEAEIKALISDNTVTGISIEGRFFSEYHQADGRVLGNNGFYVNTDACWTTKPSQICYYYGEGKDRTVHCFILDKTGDEITMRLAPPSVRAGLIDATARIEKGNPRNHGDSGKGWFCDGLISSRVLPGNRAHRNLGPSRG